MPGIDLEVLEALGRAAGRAGTPGACPRRAGSRAPEPLPSLWHAECAAAIRPDWGLEARAWVGRAGLVAWDVPPEFEARFVNLNTPEDWSRWRRGGPAREEPA
jgi:molybdopterin-guanine dinucleotide biosynthesis protein A